MPEKPSNRCEGPLDENGVWTSPLKYEKSDDSWRRGLYELALRQLQGSSLTSATYTRQYGLLLGEAELGQFFAWSTIVNGLDE